MSQTDQTDARVGLANLTVMAKSLREEIGRRVLGHETLQAVLALFWPSFEAISDQLVEEHWLHCQVGSGSIYYQQEGREPVAEVRATVVVTGLKPLGRDWLVSSLVGLFNGKSIRNAWNDRRTRFDIIKMMVAVADQFVPTDIEVICSEYRWGESGSIIYRPQPDWGVSNNICARSGVRHPDDPEYGQPHL